MNNAAPHSVTLPQITLRAPSDVMRLQRMGAFFPTRLSFMRSLIRQLAEEKARVTRPHWKICDEGYGQAVYQISLSGYTYSLVALSNNIPAEKRTDRVIAEMWDTAFVLYDGIPSPDEIARIAEAAPKQEAARFEAQDLILSRANKSLRLFNHVVDALAQGQQPELKMVREIGYLMRTTAVYGNGKFGISDRARIASRPKLEHPFRLEMLTVWLIRAFTHDLAEHCAKARAPETAVTLDQDIKRFLGIGNSTGLGMAPFLVNHPILLNNWMMVRETALARVLAIEHTTPEICDQIATLIERVFTHLHQWSVDDERQNLRVITLRREFPLISTAIDNGLLDALYPWQKLKALSEEFSVECQELIVALILEPHGNLIDGLADCMSTHYQTKLDPFMALEKLRSILENQGAWALDYDFTSDKETYQFWYVSEEKQEPRLGQRHNEEGAEREQPLDIARQFQTLHRATKLCPASMSVAEFLLQHPDFRETVKRVQALPKFPYAEIQDNLIGDQCLPIDMLRCKLSFFGASKFDPRSDRWTRITLFQGAPLTDDIGKDSRETNLDDWWLPILAEELAS